MTEKFDTRLSYSYLALFSLLYVTLPSFILSAFLILRVGSPLSAYGVSMAILCAVIFYNRDKLRPRDYAVFVFVLIFSHWLSYFIFDTSFDGMAYHQHAIKRISEGFNPIYDGYMNLGRPEDNWSDQATYFPKATWYFSAAIAAVFGDLQTGKAFHMLLLFAGLMFVLDGTKNERPHVRALWVAGVMNPVALNQLTGYVLDGAVATLSCVGVFYAYLFFSEKPISRLQHFFCLASTAMLFCVKTSGFAYGTIIIFCIAFHRLCKTYLESPARVFAKRFGEAFRSAFLLGLKLGVPVLTAVSIWGAAPYVTNVLNGRHIFYPVMGAGKYTFDDIGEAVYPDAHNRVTRLLYSIASHPNSEVEASSLKNPFDVSSDEWAMSASRNLRSAGLGPLFCLLCLISVPFIFLFRSRAGGWLMFTLTVLVFIQSAPWQTRYSPFLWLVPLICLMWVPEKWSVFVSVPVLLASVNAAGILWVTLLFDWESLGFTKALVAPNAGQTAMMPKNIFCYDGIFKRYGIKQKYNNPEENFFYRLSPALGHLAAMRLTTGTNIFFKGDLSPLPETPVLFSAPEAAQWLRMSEGIMPKEVVTRDFKKALEWRTYSGKLKFFMSMEKEPADDWVLTLKGSTFEEKWENTRDMEVLIFINNNNIGSWHVGGDTQTVTFTIPRALLEESFKDETGLVTLMIRLPEVYTPPLVEDEGDASRYGLRLEEIQISPI